MTVALAVDDLRVELDDATTVVEEIELRLRPREILGLVGESGSGKTTTALALLGFERSGTRIAGGAVRLGEHDILAVPGSTRRALRGRVISYVPQDAAQALNPSLRIGASIADVSGGQASEELVLDTLAAVELPHTREFARRYPHQLSGGQQQRVTIGMALTCGPRVVVLDEPTTGLDVVTQAAVLDEIRRLRDEEGAAMIYVSHDLAVVAQIADRIAVMYAGRIVEEGPTVTLLRRPRHPYTVGLLESVPDHLHPRHLRPMPGVAVGLSDRPPGCAFAPRCPQRVAACEAAVPPLVHVTGEQRVRCIRAPDTPAVRPGVPREQAGPATRPVLTVSDLRATHHSGGETVVAAADVGFSIGSGESVALVGESGSGKTTIARCLVGLHRPDHGSVALEDVALAPLARRRTVEQRRRVQYVFQNPYESLNPRQTVRDALLRPLRVLRGLSVPDAADEVPKLLERVRLPALLADRYPRQLSGGERQRVAIARALAARPDVLICDEITAALDVSVQAAILELLADLRASLDLATLLITHDLGVVSATADRVIVLEKGEIRETGTAAALLSAPSHAYTRRLLAAAPRMLSDDPAS